MTTRLRQYLFIFPLISLIVLLSSCVHSTKELIHTLGLHTQTANELFLEGCRLYEKDPLAAIQKFELSYAKDNTFTKGLTAASWGYLIQGHLSKNPSIATEYYKKSAACATTLTNVDSNNADGYYFLEIISNHYHDSNNAIKYALKLVNINPESKYFSYKEPYQKIDALFSLGVNYGAIQDYQNCLYYLKLYVSKYIKSKYNSELLARAKDLIPQVEAKIERDKKINALNETANRHAIHNEDIKKNDISKMTAQKNIHSKTYTKKIPIQDTKPEQRYIQSTDENRPSATSSNSSSLAYTNPAQKLPENSSGYSALSPVVQNKNNPVSGGDIMRKDHEASNVADSINFDAAVLENRSEEHVLRSMLDERMLITQLQSFL